MHQFNEPFPPGYLATRPTFDASLSLMAIDLVAPMAVTALGTTFALTTRLLTILAAVIMVVIILTMKVDDTKIVVSLLLMCGFYVMVRKQ